MEGRFPLHMRKLSDPVLVRTLADTCRPWDRQMAGRWRFSYQPGKI